MENQVKINEHSSEHESNSCAGIVNRFVDELFLLFQIKVSFGRPNASAGYWMCCLLPMALLASNYRQPICSLNFEYKMLTISSLGMCMQSINFFIYLSINSGRLMKFIFIFSPGILTSLLFGVFLQQKFTVCIFWGFFITLLYQFAYIKVLRNFSKCFTFGEASVLIQGLVLFVLNCILQLPLFIWTPPTSEFGQINAIMMVDINLLNVLYKKIYLQF